MPYNIIDAYDCIKGCGCVDAMLLLACQNWIFSLLHELVFLLHP